MYSVSSLLKISLPFIMNSIFEIFINILACFISIACALPALSEKCQTAIIHTNKQQSPYSSLVSSTSIADCISCSIAAALFAAKSRKIHPVKQSRLQHCCSYTLLIHCKHFSQQFACNMQMFNRVKVYYVYIMSWHLFDAFYSIAVS